jgi:rod shape-determining protein MreD
MIPVLFVAALVQSTMLVRVEILNVKPDLVLLLVIAGTLIYGVRRGVIWAFFGGIALDLFSGGPMGASSLALIAGAFVAGPGHSSLSRFNVFVPMTTAALGTIAYGLTYIFVLYALVIATQLPFLKGLNLETVDYRLPIVSTLQYVLLPSVAYNTLVMLMMTPLLNLVPESHDVGI